MIILKLFKELFLKNFKVTHKILLDPWLFLKSVFWKIPTKRLSQYNLHLFLTDCIITFNANPVNIVINTFFFYFWAQNVNYPHTLFLMSLDCKHDTCIFACSLSLSLFFRLSFWHRLLLVLQSNFIFINTNYIKHCNIRKCDLRA